MLWDQWKSYEKLKYVQIVKKMYMMVKIVEVYKISENHPNTVIESVWGECIKKGDIWWHIFFRILCALFHCQVWLPECAAENTV